MAISGELSTMPLVELLQWAGGNQKTGVLELERRMIRRRIVFEEGRITGCSSNDPSTRLGQFLISRGEITEKTLQFALKQHAETGNRVTDVLVEMGVITPEAIEAQLMMKAEETIYGIFDCDDAVFRFDPRAEIDSFRITISLSTDHILLKGAQRQDDIQRFREVFASSGVVLRHNDSLEQSTIEGESLLYPILDLIDGQHTLGQIMLKAHASQYQVLTVIHALYEAGNVVIVREDPVDKGAGTLLDPADHEEPTQLPRLSEVIADEERAAPHDAPRTAVRAAVREVPAEDAQDAPAELSYLIQLASQRLQRGEVESALSMLDTCYRARPDDESLRQLMAKAESSYLEQVSRYLLPPDRIPTRRQDGPEGVPLQPSEQSILEMCDGTTTVQSIVWLAPLREIDVMRALQQLHYHDLIEMIAPAASAKAG